jgi:TRAP-type C4-dicarboxylate transport system permease small subunit
MPEPASPSAGGPENPVSEAVLPVAPPVDNRRVIEDWIGAVAMGVLALITFVNVLVRYFTNQSFAWSEEFSVSLMVILTLAAASAAVVRDRHIRIELIFEAGSAARRRRLALFSALTTVVGFLILTSLGIRLAWGDYHYEVTSPGIGVPQWWYTVWLPVLSAVIAFRAMQCFVRIWLRR